MADKPVGKYGEIEWVPLKPPEGNLGALAGALAKAQGQMRGAVKNAKNPHLRNTFADLSSVLDAVREPLSTNGLCVVQLVSSDERLVSVETLLLHEGGGSISATLSVPWQTQNKGINPAQAIGIATTYARRYGLMGMVGIAPVDDDGEPPEANRAPPAAKRTQDTSAPPEAAPGPSQAKHHPSWPKSHKGFFVDLKKAGWDDYAELCKFLEWVNTAEVDSPTWSRPSLMTGAERAALLRWLTSKEGATDWFIKWDEQRQQK